MKSASDGAPEGQRDDIPEIDFANALLLQGRTEVEKLIAGGTFVVRSAQAGLDWGKLSSGNGSPSWSSRSRIDRTSSANQDEVA